MNASEQTREPKVGDTVQFLSDMPQHYPNGRGGDDDPIAAIVTRVWGPLATSYVNLTIFPDFGSPLNIGSVSHVSNQNGSSYRWRWPE